MVIPHRRLMVFGELIMGSVLSAWEVEWVMARYPKHCRMFADEPDSSFVTLHSRPCVSLLMSDDKKNLDNRVKKMKGWKDVECNECVWMSLIFGRKGKTSWNAWVCGFWLRILPSLFIPKRDKRGLGSGLDTSNSTQLNNNIRISL